MEPFHTLRRRRRRRRATADRHPPRRPRIVGRAAPRPVSWWIALGLLALAWWFPLTAHGQGLRSSTMSVSLVATRLPDSPREARDVTLDVGTVGDSALTVHLAGGPPGHQLYVRDHGGRLVSLGPDGVPVRGSRLTFRVIDPAGVPGHAAWRVVLKRAGVPWREHEVRVAQPR
ncbi:MAG: hypothetical protein JNJ98_03015 [Gemmatimonadetes bacterium]|nr:hypothetical protein [Gemmatimonadota bacterium]